MVLPKTACTTDSLRAQLHVLYLLYFWKTILTLIVEVKNWGTEQTHTSSKWQEIQPIEVRAVWNNG